MPGKKSFKHTNKHLSDALFMAEKISVLKQATIGIGNMNHFEGKGKINDKHVKGQSTKGKEKTKNKC